DRRSRMRGKLSSCCLGLQRGHGAGWVGAIGTIVAVIIASVGLHQAQPIFQNQRLQEDNARLELENRDAQKRLTDARQRTWTLACQTFVGGAEETLDRAIDRWGREIGLAEKWVSNGGTVWMLDQLNNWYDNANVLEYLQKRADGIDMTYLLEEEQTRFLTWAHQAIELEHDSLSVPLVNIISKEASSKQKIEEAKRWVADMQQARAVVSALLGNCQAAWSA